MNKINYTFLLLNNERKSFHYLISHIGIVLITVLMLCMSNKTMAQSRVFVNPGLEFGINKKTGVTFLDTNYGYGGTFNAGSTITSPWYTTHSTSSICESGTGTVGNCHPIEVWTSGFHLINAAQGNNFVELNAEEASMIYQNMYLSPGDVIKGSFKHRARLYTLEQVKWVIEDQNGAEIGVIATSTTPTVTYEWRTYTGNYTFNGAPGIYRVGFRAITGGTVGNFLDDVQIFTNPIIDLKNSTTITACEGENHGSLFLRINGRVGANTTVAVEFQNPNNGYNFASHDDITLAGVANAYGTASITRSGNIYLITIPPGDYDGGITPGYSSPSNNEDGVRININSVSDAINESTETFAFEIKAPNTNGSTNNFLTNTPVFGDTYYSKTDDYLINSCENYCTTGCNDNTYVNAVDPNTIEYDNIIGLYHTTMAKEADGTVKIWGQGAAYNGTGTNGNILTPQVINSTNYPGLTGDILRFAGGSNGNQQQFSVLTTDGLFVWGDTNVLVTTDVKNSNIFGSIAVGTYGVSGTKADGLPAGVAPEDVKMMFGTNGALSIVTCSGEAWMLSHRRYTYGDGATDSSANAMVWHRVMTSLGVPLTNVVAARGANYAMMALTSSGEIYTWGRGTRLGDGTGATDRLTATLMTKPSGVTPKMIGMTYDSGGTYNLTYYLLGTNGNLYSMGTNADGQLGNGTTTASDSWINVTATDKGASLGGNIVWISPNEHDTNDAPAINVLTTDAKLWAWGDNSGGMLDGSNNPTINPTYMPGSITETYNKGKLNLTDKLIAVETGGHTTITIKECSTKFGYLGHLVHGSMANGTDNEDYIRSYNYSDTSELAICGAVTGPIVEDLEICPGYFANLADAIPGTLPPGVTIEWWTTIDKLPGTQVTNTSSVPAGTYYAFYVGANQVDIACPSMVTIGTGSECACYKPGLTTGGDVLDTKVGITSLSRAGADNSDNWPMVRKGGWIALEAKTKGFVPNRVAFEDADNDSATPDVPVGIPAADFVEGMMVYDTTNKCMKIYTLKEGDTSMAWHCLETQACPD